MGGLLFSQLLTLFVTPVFYVYMDGFQRWLSRGSKKARLAHEPALEEAPAAR